MSDLKKVLLEVKDADIHVQVLSGSAGWPVVIPPISYDWLEDAVCAEVGGDIFFPEHGESSLPAKQLCARCPVARQCLAGAVERGEKSGIWGGVAARSFHKVRGEK